MHRSVIAIMTRNAPLEKSAVMDPVQIKATARLTATKSNSCHSRLGTWFACSDKFDFDRYLLDLPAAQEHCSYRKCTDRTGLSHQSK